MEIEEMENLLLLLKEFKNETNSSEDRRDVNVVLRIIDKTIREKQYYD